MSQQTKKQIIGLIIIVLISTSSTAIVVALKNANLSLISSSSSFQPQTATVSNTGTTTSNSSSAAYKDGTYTAKGQFYTPEGSEQIGVTIKLLAGKITSVSIDSSSIYSRTSYEYTALFADGIGSAVIGKNINDAKVSYVSGASLTPIGFDNALEIIKNNAKV